MPFVGAVERGGQRALRLVSREPRGDDAALTVAFRIADQHGLQPLPRGQVALVDLVGQELAHHLTAAVERRDRIELRRHIDRRGTGTAVTRPGPMRQHQRRQHVRGGGRRADDVQADRGRAVTVAGLHDRLEHSQRAPAQRVEGLRRPGVAGQHFDQPCVLLGRAPLLPLGIIEPLRDHGVMHAGVLAQVERRQVKAESVDAIQEPAHQEVAGVRAAIGAQALGDQGDIAAELRRPLVAVGTTLEGIAEPLGDLPEECPVRHRVVPRGRQPRCPRQERAVFLDAPRHCRAYADAASALRELLRQRLAFVEIVVDDDLLLPRQGFADALGVHVGGAVHVATHPGAEADQQWQFQGLGVGSI